jgi:hypothetical protein
MFWEDLSTAGLIEGGYNQASPLAPSGATITGSAIATYFPPAKVGTGNYVYVWSTGCEQSASWTPPGLNYFGISAVTSLGSVTFSSALFPVRQAYAIDAKIDDGLPQTGRVMMMYIDSAHSANNPIWPGANWQTNGLIINATPATTTSCWDNGNTWNGPQEYSISSLSDYGAHANCALSFKMQGAAR